MRLITRDIADKVSVVTTWKRIGVDVQRSAYDWVSSGQGDEYRERRQANVNW